MRQFVVIGTLALASVSSAAQQPDSVRADSIRRAQEDSIQLVRDLERITGDRRAPAGMAPQPAVQGPANPALLPNISAIGDVVLDASPDGSTQEDGSRATIREVELGVQAAVDPYFRADFFLGIHGEGIEVEEAYLSTLSLPWSSQLRVGKVLLPVGKQNTIHRPELHTIEHSYVVQDFLGAEGLKGTGLWFSKVFAPFGFYQEIQLAAVDRFGGEQDAHGEEAAEPEPITSEPANRSLGGLGYVARLRNYYDITDAANVELSGSFATGKRAVHVECVGPDAPDCFGGLTGVNARQSLLGADLTLRWKPLDRALYKSFLLQAEWLRQVNVEPDLPVPPPGNSAELEAEARSYDGAYVFARYQLTRRIHIGGRYDWLQDPHAGGEAFAAATAQLTMFPSEFSKMVLGVERVMPAAGEDGFFRLLFQTTFAVGPHRPHPF